MFHTPVKNNALLDIMPLPTTPVPIDTLTQASSFDGASTSQSSSQPPQNDQRAISRVSVRPPPFWRENPALWFKQLESQFITSGITVSDTKFHTAVSALDTAVISQVSDLIMNPPAEGKYELLKQRLQERFADSEEQRFRKLLGNLDLGDRKPSHLWREMRELAGNNNLNEHILKSLWMQRLPTQSQAILSAEEGNTDRLLILADRIHDIFGAREVNAASAQEMQSPARQSPATQQTLIEQLTKNVGQLTKQIAAFTSNNQNQKPKARARSVSRSADKRSTDSRSSNSRTPSKETHANCWYHHRYGKDARKCIAPCKFNDVSEN